MINALRGGGRLLSETIQRGKSRIMYREKEGENCILALLSFFSRRTDLEEKPSNNNDASMHHSVDTYIYVFARENEIEKRTVRRKHPDWFHPDRPFPRILRFIVSRGWSLSQRIPRVSIRSISIRLLLRFYPDHREIFDRNESRSTRLVIEPGSRCMRCTLKSWRATFTKIVEIGRHANGSRDEKGVNTTGARNRAK